MTGFQVAGIYRSIGNSVSDYRYREFRTSGMNREIRSDYRFSIVFINDTGVLMLGEHVMTQCANLYAHEIVCQ